MNYATTKNAVGQSHLCHVCRRQDAWNGNPCRLCRITLKFAVSDRFARVMRYELRWPVQMIEEVAAQITRGEFTEAHFLKTQCDPSFPESWPTTGSCAGQARRRNEWSHAMAVTNFDQVKIEPKSIYGHTRSLPGAITPMISIITITQEVPTKIERFGCANDAAIALLKKELKDEAFKLVTEPLTIDGEPNPMVALSNVEERKSVMTPTFFAQLD